ncbi:STAS domain-containing protein [Paenibacillus oleatilyticus]|uniref:Anti-sigma factor antagonist n=1 Tax=Paenibacillus oleatilyticus TaxID=2594886 RepID=A0ABV4UZR1_9BACL
MDRDAQKFHVKVLNTPEANVLFLSGELDLSTAEQFRSVVEPLAGQRTVPLKLNLRELTYIDSTGIGIFVSVLKKRQPEEASFAVQEVPAKIRRLFDMTGLSRYLTMEGGGL